MRLFLVSAQVVTMVQTMTVLLMIIVGNTAIAASLPPMLVDPSLTVFFDCFASRPECGTNSETQPAPRFTSDGLRFITHQVETDEFPRKVKKIRFWVSDRNPTGWRTQLLELNLEDIFKHISVYDVSEVHPSNDKQFIVFNAALVDDSEKSKARPVTFIVNPDASDFPKSLLEIERRSFGLDMDFDGFNGVAAYSTDLHNTLYRSDGTYRLYRGLEVRKQVGRFGGPIDILPWDSYFQRRPFYSFGGIEHPNRRTADLFKTEGPRGVSILRMSDAVQSAYGGAEFTRPLNIDFSSIWQGRYGDLSADLETNSVRYIGADGHLRTLSLIEGTTSKGAKMEDLSMEDLGTPEGESTKEYSILGRLLVVTPRNRPGNTLKVSRLIDIESGKTLSQLEGLIYHARDFSPDGKYCIRLFAGNSGVPLSLIEIATQKVLLTGLEYSYQGGRNGLLFINKYGDIYSGSTVRYSSGFRIYGLPKRKANY